MSRFLWLALVLVISLGVCAGVSTLAQDDGPGGPGGGGPGGAGGAGGPGGRRSGGGMGGPMGMMSGGGAALIAHKDHLYAISGSRLIKIDPEAMKVVGELELGSGGSGAGSRRPPRPGEGEDFGPGK